MDEAHARMMTSQRTSITKRDVERGTADAENE